MYLSLGSLCVTPLTKSLKTSKRSTPFRRRKMRNKNSDNNKNDMMNNDNDDNNNNDNNYNNNDKIQINNNEKCTKKNKEEKKNESTSTLTWMHRLSLSDDIETVKELALEMVHSIHPCAFLPSWYMSLEESTPITQTQNRNKDGGVSTGVQSAPNSTGTSTFEGRFWIGKHPKNGTVRLPTFFKLSDALKENKLVKSDTSDSNDSDGDGYSDGDDGGDGVSVNNDKDEEDYEENEDGEVVVVVRSKNEKKGDKINKDGRKDIINTWNKDDGEGEEKGGEGGEGGRKVDDTDADVEAEADVEVDVEGDVDGEEEEDDDDDDQKSNKNTHATPRLYSFSYNKHNIPHNQRACVPPKLLRRIARLGATAFIPFVTYPKCPVQFPSPPYAWIWEYQLRNCKFIESVALQLRILEGYLKIQELPMGILDLKFQVNLFFVFCVFCFKR
jgi:hypothetical protein